MLNPDKGKTLVALKNFNSLHSSEEQAKLVFDSFKPVAKEIASLIDSKIELSLFIQRYAKVKAADKKSDDAELFSNAIEAVADINTLYSRLTRLRS